MNKLYIVTAAHCVRDKDSEKYRIEVGCQDTRITNDKRTYKVDSIIIHSEYKGSDENKGIDHDIALIKLQHPVKFTEFAQPIELIKSNKIRTTNGIIVGWGMDQWRGNPTHVLNKAELPIRSNEECTTMLNTVRGTYRENRIVTIRKSHLCAGYDKGGTDGCQVSQLISIHVP